MRLLLIEDDDDHRDLVAGWLTRCFPDASVYEAASFSAAKDALREGPFDVVLTDLGLPDSTHDQTMLQLPRLVGGAPLIVLTGHGKESAALRALKTGAEDYLVKGQVTPELLRRSVLYAHERQALKRRLMDLANHDALTGLLSRAPFLRKVREAWARSARYGDRIALAFVDIDHFKEVNDSFGHEVGDGLLKAIARRLNGSVRSTDHVARLGGDEFAVLLDRISDESLERVLERMLEGLREPIEVAHTTLRVSASIGVARPDPTCESVGDLFRHADAAMYQAKSGGRDRYRYFDSDLHRQIRTERDVLRALRRAIAEREFVLHYQPVLNAQTGLVESAEALLRWQHPSDGPLEPSAFIEGLERDAMIVELGKQVLHQVCEELAAQRSHGGSVIPIAVNVSAKEFEAPGFVELVDRTLAETGVRPHELKLEITERMLVRDLPRARQVVRDLAGLGVDMAIDDFGMGYSSLAYLRSLPVKTLKIDRTFISGTPEGEADTAIVGAVIQLAHALGYRVVAEGVESASQLQALREMGCDAWQGFLCAEAMPVAKWHSWIAQHQGRVPEGA